MIGICDSIGEPGLLQYITKITAEKKRCCSLGSSAPPSACAIECRDVLVEFSKLFPDWEVVIGKNCRVYIETERTELCTVENFRHKLF
jgi:hypothetical protein